MKKIFTALFALLLCTTLYAGQIKQIVILGDSLSDNGNLYNTLKIIPKSPPYYQGRFTNGPTWAEHVGNYFYNKSFIATDNYAVGGATSILHSPLHDSFFAPVTLTGEFYDYSARSLFIDKSNVLYVIWIGANDYLYEKEPNTDYVASSVVNNIAWTINSLISQGARNFVVMNLPDLAKTPYAKENKLTAQLYAISQLHNKKLADAMKVLKAKNPTVKFAYIDVYSIFNDLLTDTNKFNQQFNKHITDINTACWKGPMLLQSSNDTLVSSVNADLKKAFLGNKITLNKNFDTLPMSKAIVATPSLSVAYTTGKMYENGILPCNNADDHVFWDDIHPTEAVHQVLASIVEQQLTGFDI